MQEDGHIGVEEIKDVRLTKKNAEVIKVVLNTGEELICTPDHKFRLVDGSYIQAKDLTPVMNLAPLYRKISKKEGRSVLVGYEMVYDPAANKWNYTHVLADIFNLKNKIYVASAGKHRHHVDFNKRNNNPTNIQRLPYEEHMKIHYANIEKTLLRPEVQEKANETRRKPENRERARQKTLEKRDLFSENAKKQWENLEYKALMTKTFLEFYNSNEEYRKNNNKLLDKNQK